MLSLSNLLEGAIGLLVLLHSSHLTVAVDMAFQFFEDAISRGLVCNDGTRAGYYFRASSSGSRNWLVHLQGGGWCYDEQSCHQRIDSKKYMINVDWRATWQGGNISKDGIFNDLSDSNLVYLPYCSGDAWMGNSTAWGFPFRGRHIVQTLISELDVQTGDDFVLSGCSAGGRGAMVQLDTLRELLPSGCRVRGVLDSPAWQDMDLFYPEPSAHTFGYQCELAYEIFAPPISPACAMAYPQEDHWRCICGEYTLPYLREDYFLIAYLYDSFQLTTLEVWMHPPYEGARLEYAESFAQHMNNTVVEVHRAGKAVSAPACYMHCATEDSRFHTVSADGELLASPACPLSQVLETLRCSGLLWHLWPILALFRPVKYSV